MIAELIMRLFHTRTNAHVLHLQTDSLAKHLALNEFYEGVVGLADRIAEGYQGEHGLIDFTSPHRYTPQADPIKCLTDLKEWIEANRYDAIEAEDTFLHNLVDEVIQLCASTLYKLKVFR